MHGYFEILDSSEIAKSEFKLIFECEIDGIVPSVNNYWRHTKQGHHYISQKGRDFKDLLSWIAKSKKSVKSSGKILFFVDWHCKKLCRGGDLDNRLKVLLDALSGVVYDDDKQVVSIVANKILNSGVDKAVIKVFEVEGI